MYWKLFGMYLMFFYTDIFGIPAAAVGTMFLITRSAMPPSIHLSELWATVPKHDGENSGRISYGWPFRSVYRCFNFYHSEFKCERKNIYAYATYTVMMIIYSMINVPYASLMAS